MIDKELPFVAETDTTVRFPLGKETALFLRDLASMTKQMVSSVGDDESVLHDTLLQPANSDALDSDVVNGDDVFMLVMLFHSSHVIL